MVDRVCLWFPAVHDATPLRESLQQLGIHVDVRAPPLRPTNDGVLTFVYIEHIQEVSAVVPNWVYVTPDRLNAVGLSHWLSAPHTSDELLALLLRWDREHKRTIDVR